MNGVPESGRRRVYRKLCDVLRANPTLRAAGVRWVTWDGREKDVRVETAPDKITIRLFPGLGPVDFRGPEAVKGDLQIHVAMWVPNTHDACDVLDLWTAIEDAISPAGDRARRQAIRADLKGCPNGPGCGPCDSETGEVRFVQPAAIEPAFTGEGQSIRLSHFYAEGLMTIDILRTINP